MASRNYGMAYDTPYNERLLRTLEDYNRDRDTNGEPMYFHEVMEGGAFLGPDGRLTSMNHPHLGHPIYGSMNREMAGGMSARQVFGTVGDLVAPPFVRRLGMDIAKDVGKYALQEGKKEASKRGREYVDAYMGQGVSGGYRPPGMVSPFIHPTEPSQMVSPGTMASYPAYNAVEMRSMNGGFFIPAMMAVGRVAGPAIASAVVSHLANKAMGGSAVCASCEGAQTGGKRRPKKGKVHMMPDGSMMLDSEHSGAGLFEDLKHGVEKVATKRNLQKAEKIARMAVPVAEELLGSGKKRGRKKGAGILDAKFSVNDIKNTGRELLGMGILDDKFSINDIKNTGRELFGLGVKKRGRPKKGGNILGDVGRTIGKVGKSVGSVVLPIAREIAVDVAKNAVKSYLTGSTGVKTGKGVGVGVMKGGAMDGRKRRAEVVKRIMKEKGMKMIEASSYVKKHGLYA